MKHISKNLQEYCTKTTWNLITNLLTATTIKNKQPTNPTQYTLIADDYKEEEEQEDPKKLLHDLLALTICQTERSKRNIFYFLTFSNFC